MARRSEVREFLVSRRARLSPENAGLPSPIGARRVPGLRREEAAALAGVSVDYYTRLERGDASGVSASVLDNVSRALQLDEAERLYLTALVRAPSSTTRSRTRAPAQQAPASLQRVIASMGDAPAFISNSRLDLVAANELCAALYVHLADDSVGHVNLARYTFLDPRSAEFYTEWHEVAEMTVALLRASAGTNPLDRDLEALIDELATRSDVFAEMWDAQHVRQHTSGRKRLRHPVVGDLELTFDSMTLSADPTLTLTVYTAEPRTVTEQNLQLLGKWAAENRQQTKA